MKKIVKILLVALAVVTLAVSITACDFGEKIPAPTGKAAYDTSATGEGQRIKMSVIKQEIGSMKASDFEASEQKSDFVLIKVKDYGEIVVVLRRDIAPETVNNFKKLVSNKFYDGTVFHRVIENFMIQGGGYVPFDGKLTEKSADTIKGEFNHNGFTNKLGHVRGVISMARRPSSMDSASSEFFIMHSEHDSLNSEYAAFGYVLAGMDVVDAIATCDVDDPSSTSPRPVKDVIIESVTFVQPK